MDYYKSTYSPGYTTNDTYGNFYDAKKVSLITVPERLKNYDLDVRKMHTPTSGSEYGDFLRGDDPYATARQFSVDQQQQQQPYQLPQQYQQDPYQLPQQYQQIQQEQAGIQAPASHRLPPPPPQLSQYEQQQMQHRAALDLQQQHVQEEQRQQRQQDDSQQQTRFHHDEPAEAPEESPRQPPPEETYHHTGRRAAAQETYRLPRSRSPPPPPDLGAYKSHMDLYTGRRARAAPPRQEQPHEEDAHVPEMTPSLPPLRYGSKEIRLPDIDAVELHMRDRSKILLNVREFYSKYLRD